MAKKPPPVDEPPDESWMATFADAITLLMAFFVMLLTFADYDIPAFDEAAAAIAERVGGTPQETPAAMMSNEIEDAMFSGDFIFERSIGRTDFPFSSPEDMKDSLKRFKELDYDKTIYPGHGGTTTIKQEQQYADYWINSL